MNMAKVDLMLEKLENVYVRARSASQPADFFQALYEYMSFYDEDDTLVPVVKEIAETKELDLALLNQLAQEANTEMEHVFNATKKFIKKNIAKHKEIRFPLSEFHAHEENRILTTAAPTETKFSTLGRVFYLLLGSEYQGAEKFVSQFATVTGTRQKGNLQIDDIHFEPIYRKWRAEHVRIERLQPFKVWFAWDKLVGLCSLYRDYETASSEHIKNEKLLMVLATHSVFKKIQRLMGDKSTNGTFSVQDMKEMEEHRICLERVHLLTKQHLLSMPVVDVKVSDVPEKKIKWVYDKELGELIMDGCHLIFRPSKTRDLLNVVLNDDNSIQQEWFYDELNELIEGMKVEKFGKEEKDKFYEVCKAIVRRIAAKSGIVQFLIFNKSSVKVNPIYWP